MNAVHIALIHFYCLQEFKIDYDCISPVNLQSHTTVRHSISEGGGEEISIARFIIILFLRV